MKIPRTVTRTAIYSAALLIIQGCGTTTPALHPPPPDQGPVQQTGRRIEMHADRILRNMSDCLKSANAYTFAAESSYDAKDHNGQNIRYGGKVTVSHQKPNLVLSCFNGDERRTTSYYNGKTFTVYNEESSMYAMIDVPPVIDDAIDAIMERTGISMPLADLLYTDPYSILVENVIEGRWIGLHEISGVPCNHLAFTQENVDWQIWIDAGDRPLPRQVLITYKDEPGSPQYLARLASWNFEPKFPSGHFEFTPPEGAGEIEFITHDKQEAGNE